MQLCLPPAISFPLDPIITNNYIYPQHSQYMLLLRIREQVPHLTEQYVQFLTLCILICPLL